jgi:CBS domain containing-hemolysin-like protein
VGGDAGLQDLASDLPTVPPDLPVSDLIDRLQEAALVAENGRTLGQVTATDGSRLSRGS